MRDETNRSKIAKTIFDFVITNNYDGIWNVYSRIIGYNSSGDESITANFININFISPNEILNINGEWKSILETNTKVQLTKKVNDQTYLLTLEKSN